MKVIRMKKLALFLSLSLWCAPSAQAACDAAGDPSGCGSGPASQGSSSGTDLGAGNPIHILSGNKYQREVDMPALPGELGLELVRHYNSNLALPSQPSAAWGLLGPGWRLSYETRLHRAGRNLWIEQADGSSLPFAADLRTPGLWRSPGVPSSNPQGETGSVQEQPVAKTNTNPQGLNYLWRWANGRELRFDGQGRLQQISAPSGHAVQLHYDLRGWLLRVVDPQGRSLRLNYPALASLRPGQFAGVQSIDTPVGRVSYERTQASAAAQESSQAKAQTQALSLSARLQVVTLPTMSAEHTATKRHYHYEDPRWPALMTGISVSGANSLPAKDAETAALPQRIGSYAYDEHARAWLSVRGPFPLEAGAASTSYPTKPTTRDLGAGPEQVRLLWLADVTNRVRVQLTNSLGQRTLYLGQRIAGQLRLLQATGPGCSLCGPTNVRLAYDDMGRLRERTELNPAGQPARGQRFAYDGAGRPLELLAVPYQAGQAQPAQWIERYGYGPSPTQQLPLRIERPSVVPGQVHQVALAYNEAGQITRVTESGMSPIDAQGQLRPVPIERSTAYTWQRIAGKSVLTQIDGPLPNGPKADSGDSDVTRFEWDKEGRFLTALLQPGGQRSSLGYDDAGRVAQVQNGQGLATQLRYNAQGQLLHISSQGPGWAQAQVQAMGYDVQGRAIEMSQGLANQQTLQPQWRQAFDAAGRLQWRASALGMLQHYQWDTESHLLEQGRRSNAMAQINRYQYNDQGQLSQASDNAGRSWQSPTGSALAAISASPKVASAFKGIQPAKYDTASAASELLDDFGRKVLTQSPDHGRSVKSFDAANRLTHMTDAAGNSAAYEHTLQGRISRQTVMPSATSTAQETRWHYNAQGQLTRIDHPTQSERYEYDARGLQTARIVTLKTAQGEHTAVTRFSHDAQGQLLSSTLPDGTLVRYERNGQNQVTGVQRNPVRTPWLRWLGQEQTVVQDLARDLMGLKSYSTGNGIQAQFQRSGQGDLARVVYRHTSQRPALQVRNTSAPLLMGRSVQDSIDFLLGVRPAYAADLPKAEQASTTQAPKLLSQAPGALGLPADPQALLDHRYLWSDEGLLLHSQQRAGGPSDQYQHSHAYDRQGRLLASVQASLPADAATQVQAPAPSNAQEQAVWRFAYDAQQRRVLSQQGVSSQGELSAGTQRSQFQPGSHRLGLSTTYTPSGQPERMGQREYVWDALGRLVEVRQEAKALAIYQYDHRGLRVSKQAKGQSTHTLYDESRQPLAELNAQSRITRQYIWLADMPLAVIDSPQGQALASDTSGLGQVIADIAAALQSWFASDDGITWLHTNHLGAPEAATNAQGQLVWQARYAPFGAAQVTSQSGFTLNLRLPGQVFDEETSLHYNRQRYYDSERGQYLTPDPLGHPDGPNPYAYVAFNPLANIDPDGLILFAFDGTNNSDPPQSTRIHGGR